MLIIDRPWYSWPVRVCGARKYRPLARLVVLIWSVRSMDVSRSRAIWIFELGAAAAAPLIQGSSASCCCCCLCCCCCWRCCLGERAARRAATREASRHLQTPLCVPASRSTWLEGNPTIITNCVHSLANGGQNEKRAALLRCARWRKWLERARLMAAQATEAVVLYHCACTCALRLPAGCWLAGSLARVELA